MAYIALKDILISARQESHRMRHYYLGVEHIFIALLEVKGGIASSILESYGFQPNYVIDAIRRKVGKGGRHRLWAGTPNTPRATIILDIAHEIAVADNRDSIHERDLLIAILDESDNIPTRVLGILGLDIDMLKTEVRTRKSNHGSHHTFVNININPDAANAIALTKEQSYILRRMFHGYASIRIEQKLEGGYTPAALFVVTPIQTDSREDATVVVKIGPTDLILDEAHRYERYVKSTLPPLTARLEDTPTAPEASDLAGVKYTFVTGSDEKPHDLRSITRQWNGDKLGSWIYKNIHHVFGKTWWMQNSPYRFEVWREYDWLLPPILTLELIADKKSSTEIHKIKPPIKRIKLREFEYGEVVAVENFIVQKVDKDQKSIQLAVGHGTDAASAYKIEIRNIDFHEDTFYRSEIVDIIVGRVWKTRAEQFNHAVRALDPSFPIDQSFINHGNFKLPNPIFAYQEIMDMTIEGSLCTIHGDLHLGNILIGPSENALLIDFAHTRDGHTVFDWATMELSLLSDYIVPLTNNSWESTWTLASYLHAINNNLPLPSDNSDLTAAFKSIQELRNIVKECLVNKTSWAEYYVALALTSLRAMTWKTMSLASRRLMYINSGLAIHALLHRQRNEEDTDHTVTDTTDHISNY